MQWAEASRGPGAVLRGASLGEPKARGHRQPRTHSGLTAPGYQGWVLPSPGDLRLGLGSAQPLLPIVGRCRQTEGKHALVG